MTQAGLIDVQGLHKHYRDGEGNELHILRGLEVQVAAGDTVSIMGASGVGKSTFLHMLGALDHIESGTITVQGVELSTLTPDAAARFRNQTIGFVFQFHHLLMDFSALENVMIPMWIRAGRTVPREREAMELLAEVGLSDRAAHRPAQLSGGEQQRLAVARAIANRPPLLLADEPTGNLDEANGERVAELLLRLNREQGLTLILVTHNPQFAARMARQYVLEHGQLHASAKVSQGHHTPGHDTHG